ncbi:MAG: response regulator, partial [Candidatus Manganitrophaceae bacterium]
RGATFTVTLPVRSVRMRATQESPVSAKTPRDALGGLRILVVDDEADARDLVATVLRQCRADVSAVSSAREAMRVFEEGPPDVLISDIAMPEEDGYVLIRKIRALAAERGGETPAVALTAYARSEDRQKILSSGFQVHLSKPVEPAQLVASVAKVAGRE